MQSLLYEKKKKKKSWNGNVEMWLESCEDVKVIQIQKQPWNTYGFFYPKKEKKLCYTNPKRKIVVATSHLSKLDGQVGVIVLW